MICFTPRRVPFLWSQGTVDRVGYFVSVFTVVTVTPYNRLNTIKHCPVLPRLSNIPWTQCYLDVDIYTFRFMVDQGRRGTRPQPHLRLRPDPLRHEGSMTQPRSGDLRGAFGGTERSLLVPKFPDGSSTSPLGPSNTSAQHAPSGRPAPRPLRMSVKVKDLGRGFTPFPLSPVVSWTDLDPGVPAPVSVVYSSWKGWVTEPPGRVRV